MGAALELPIAYTVNLEDTLRALRATHRIVALEQTRSAISLAEYAVPERFVLVLGSERHGVDQSVLDVCHDTVVIPMQTSTVASLNVSAAAAIALAHFSRLKSASPEQKCFAQG